MTSHGLFEDRGQSTNGIVLCVHAHVYVLHLKHGQGQG